MKSFIFTLSIYLCFGFANEASARSFRVNQIPNGAVNGCKNCHVSSTNSTRNLFGKTIDNGFLNGDNVIWNATLANLDSDGDGFTNGTELQDPTGAWSIGMSNPGDASNISNPGEKASVPTDVFDNQPIQFAVSSLSPNPFANSIAIDYEVNKSGFLTVSIIDINGKTIKVLLAEYQFAGIDRLTWDGTDKFGNLVNSGNYFISFSLNNKTITKSIVFIK